MKLGVGRSVLKWVRLALLPLVACSCAKFPTVSTTDSTRVTFKMQVKREIRSDYVYIIGIRTSTDANPDANGPIPVINYPAVNGFVAGSPNYFVKWDPLQSRAYILYKFTNTDLTAWREIGVPISQVDVTTGGRILQFELSLDQLVDTTGTSNTLQTLQVNFLTMNRVSQSSGTNRVIDALGDTRLASEINNYVKIPLTTSGTYDNSRFNLIEPTSADNLTTDCPDPDLDIVDWSIEVRRQ